MLVVENVFGQADSDAAILARAGNNVFHCFPDAWGRDERSDPFVCIGVTQGACPLDCGIDVTLQRQDGSFPSIFTAGALCARRRGIPVAAVDRGADVIEACETAVEHGYDQLRAEIGRRIAPLLAEEHLRFDEISLDFETVGPNLRVTVSGPPLSASSKERLAVRITDGVRDSRRVFNKKSVIYVES